jgi:hypothetical protein
LGHFSGLLQGNPTGETNFDTATWKTEPYLTLLTHGAIRQSVLDDVSFFLFGMEDELFEKSEDRFLAARSAIDDMRKRAVELDNNSAGESFAVNDGGSWISKLAAIEMYKSVRKVPITIFADNLLAFLHDRLKVWLRDQGIRHDVIDACLAMPGNDDLTLLVKRAEALSAVLKTEDGANLLAGFKRANNILTQAEEKDGVEYSYGADIKFAETDAERALFTALDQAEATITPALQSEDFATAMAAMASLRAPIDAFFTDVQVNSDNPIIRRNRLNLLHRIRSVCGQVADLTRLEG